ncbi:MAG: ABC transporter permease [Acidimicrobiales bacterium]
MTGAVYDRGYRPYEGARGGRRAARAALWRLSIRRALGLRRPWRQKVAPFVLLGIAVIPAIVNVGVEYLTRDTVAEGLDFITYREYVGVSNALLVFVALTAPDIMCPDRRQRVLPLIFARPLTGTDYVLAKVGAMASILFAFSFLPQVVLFVGQMLVSDDGALRYLRDNAEVLWQVPIAVALLALYYASIGVAIASLTTRRIIAGATIIGLFLVSSIVASIVTGPEERVSFRGGPPNTIITEDGGVVVVPGPLTPGSPRTPGSGSPFGSTDGPVLEPGPSQTDQYFIVRREPTAGPLLNLLGLPLVLRDLVFLGEVDDAEPLHGYPGAAGYAIGIYVALVGAALVVLRVRYSEVER